MEALAKSITFNGKKLPVGVIKKYEYAYVSPDGRVERLSMVGVALVIETGGYSGLEMKGVPVVTLMEEGTAMRATAHVLPVEKAKSIAVSRNGTICILTGMQPARVQDRDVREVKIQSVVLQFTQAAEGMIQTADKKAELMDLAKKYGGTQSPEYRSEAEDIEYRYSRKWDATCRRYSEQLSKLRWDIWKADCLAERRAEQRAEAANGKK